MNQREVEQMIDAKIRLMEDRLMKYIDNKLKTKDDNQCREIVLSGEKLKKEMRRDMVMYYNKEINPQLQSINQAIACMRVENDGTELVTEYRRRLDVESNSRPEESYSAQQGPKFYFSEND